MALFVAIDKVNFLSVVPDKVMLLYHELVSQSQTGEIRSF